MTVQICLGTAQFGSDYGITNEHGQVSSANVSNILSLAHQKNIQYLDTARSYGNSEIVIGSNLPLDQNFLFISKLEAQNHQYFTKHNVEMWESAFKQSCYNLKVSRLDSYLVHSPMDLRKDGYCFLVKWLLGLKDRGLVKRLGVSIYNSDDLQNVPIELLDIVQLPLSLFDQRLLEDGTIDYLRSNNVAIHARSLYLQGLLLTPASQWPYWASVDAVNHQSNLELFAKKQKCNLIDLAVGFAHEQDYLEAVVLGICNTHQLIQLTDAWSRPSPWSNRQWSTWALNDNQILDPRLWPQ